MSQLNKIAAFRNLHQSGCFVIPNPWDKGTAACLESFGFAAVATTSAGLGFSLGIPDSVGTISRDTTLKHIKDIVDATSIPVNADFQEGFAHTPEELFENVKLCVATGAAGLSIEDATGNPDQPLFVREDAIERMRAARAAIDATGVPVVLTGRCEAWLVGDKDPFRTALDRLVAFAEIGADCLFAPGVKDPKQIQEIVKAVHPKPVNVIVPSFIPGLSVAVLQDLGVRRVSVGSALSRVAWKAFMDVAMSIRETGTFDGLSNAASFAELNGIFAKPRET